MEENVGRRECERESSGNRLAMGEMDLKVDGVKLVLTSGCLIPANTAESVQKPRTVLQKHLAYSIALVTIIEAMKAKRVANAALAKAEIIGIDVDRAKTR